MYIIQTRNQKNDSVGIMHGKKDSFRSGSQKLDSMIGELCVYGDVVIEAGRIFVI